MTSAAPIRVRNLPRDHLFRLIHRAYDSGDDVDDWDRFSDLARPVDWDAFSARLQTRQGRDEATQWVRTGRSAGRTLLHELCGFNFGKVVDERGGGRPPPLLSVDGPTALRVLTRVMEICPDAARTRDLEGYYPLHVVCARRPVMEGEFRTVRLDWNRATAQVFALIRDAHPDAVDEITSDSKTALHLLAEANHTGYGASTPDENEACFARGVIFDSLLRAFPRAVEVRDEEGRLPLHIAANTYQDPRALWALIAEFPAALRVKCGQGMTPVLSFLRSCNRIDLQREAYKLGVVREMLASCPRAVEVEDDNAEGDSTLQVVHGMMLTGAGDALDYAALNYCDALRLDWLATHSSSASQQGEGEDTVNEEGRVEVVPYNGSYLETNKKALGTDTDLGRVLELAKDGHEGPDAAAFAGRLNNDNTIRAHEALWSWNVVLAALYATNPQDTCMPLHAFVRGRACRPWNLAVFERILWRHRGEAALADGDGKLPLHLFLESCASQRERALARKFVRDDAEYDRAVAACFDMLFAAYPDAARWPCPDGRSPLHVAIEHCGRLPHSSIVDVLLARNPGALAARDVKRAGLRPFAAAAVGEGADLDLAYHLLRKDPSMLVQSVETSQS